MHRTTRSASLLVCVSVTCRHDIVSKLFASFRGLGRGTPMCAHDAVGLYCTQQSQRRRGRSASCDDTRRKSSRPFIISLLLLLLLLLHYYVVAYYCTARHGEFRSLSVPETQPRLKAYGGVSYLYLLQNIVRSLSCGKSGDLAKESWSALLKWEFQNRCDSNGNPPIIGSLSQGQLVRNSRISVPNLNPLESLHHTGQTEAPATSAVR